MRKSEQHGLQRKVCRALERRWRKEKNRSVPSPSAAFRYLSNFHDPEQEKLRKKTDIKAFIPAPNEHLKGLEQINKDICGSLNLVSPQKTATLDMDATLVETNKNNALWCYKGFKSYQPLNTWWYEQGVILHTQFRDGNVPAGFTQLNVFKKALNCLPEGVEKVKLRSDTAGYQHDLLKYCEKGENKRFGRIEFAIGCNVTPAFKTAVAQVPDSEWHPIYKCGFGNVGPYYVFLRILEGVFLLWGMLFLCNAVPCVPSTNSHSCIAINICPKESWTCPILQNNSVTVCTKFL